MQMSVFDFRFSDALRRCLAPVLGCALAISLSACGGNKDTYDVTLKGGGGAGDFTIGVTPASQSIDVFNEATYTVTVTSVNGFNGPVQLSVAGAPTGSNVLVTVSPNPVTPSAEGTTSTLTINDDRGLRSRGDSAQTGTFNMTITGVSGSLQHSIGATLIINGV